MFVVRQSTDHPFSIVLAKVSFYKQMSCNGVSMKRPIMLDLKVLCLQFHINYGT